MAHNHEVAGSSPAPATTNGEDRKYPAWVKCICGDFWCSIHGKHAYECECPYIDEWEVDPYVEGGQPC